MTSCNSGFYQDEYGATLIRQTIRVLGPSISKLPIFLGEVYLLYETTYYLVTWKGGLYWRDYQWPNR